MQLCLQKTMKSTKLTHDIDIMAPSYDTMLHNLIELKCNSFEKWIEAQQSIAVNPESSKYKLLDLQIRHAMTTFIDVQLLAILYKHLTECSAYNTVELSTFCEAVVNIEFDFILKFRQDIMSHDMPLGAHLDNHIDVLCQFVMCMYNKSKGAATTIVQHYIAAETISQLVLHDSRHQMIESMIAQLDKFDLVGNEQLNVRYAIIKQLETKVSCNTAMLTRFVDDAIRFEICNTASDAFKFAVKLMCTRLNKALLDDNSSRPLRKVALEHMIQIVQQSLQSSMYNLHDVKQIKASCTLIVYNALLANFQQQN